MKIPLEFKLWENNFPIDLSNNSRLVISTNVERNRKKKDRFLL